MRYDDEHLSLRTSMRAVAAAWIFCGFVVLSAFLAASGGKRGDGSIAAYAGVRIPSHSGWSAHDISPADDLDDPAGGLDDPAAVPSTADGTWKGPSCCSTFDVAEYTTLATEASAFMSARSRCSL